MKKIALAIYGALLCLSCGQAARADRIYFQTERTAPSAEIWSMNDDGSDQRRVTRGASLSRDDLSPDVSTDGRRVVFASSPLSRTQYDLFIINSDGSGEQRLASTPNDWESTPVFNPVFTIIAYTSFIPGGPSRGIFVMNSDGTGIRRVTPAGLPAVGPSWSPDGRRLVFEADVSGQGTDRGIYTINLDGSGLTRLTPSGVASRTPAWSPLGDRIAFNSSRSGNDEIYLINTDGSNVQRVTNTVTADFRPAFRADGQKIAFQAYSDAAFAFGKIYTVNLNGTDLRLLSDQKDNRPSWGPRLADPNPTATPGPVATATPVPVATATPGPVATATPGPVATATPGPVATATPGPVATATPGPVATATPGPVATATPNPGGTPSPTATPIPGVTPGPTATPIPGVTPTPRPTLAPVAPKFAPAIITNIGRMPDGLVVSDFNRDGRFDVATANSRTRDVSILTGDAINKLTSAGVKFVGASIIPIAAGDFNNDRVIDVAVVSGNSQRVFVLLGDGRSGFSSIIASPAISPTGIAVGDFNRDGKLDVAVGNYSRSTVTVLLGDGRGTLRPGAVMPVGASPSGILAADLNRDGRLDLVSIDNRGAGLSFLAGDGTGKFAPRVALGVGILNPGIVNVAAGDIDSNGTMDLVTANRTSRNLTVLSGDNRGGFTLVRQLATPFAAEDVAIADFNGDTRLDIAATGGRVRIFTSLGGGRFGGPYDFLAGTAPRALRVVDFNRDRQPDLIIAGANTVTILLNITLPPADARPPVISFAQPLNGAILRNLSGPFYGPVTDNVGGSGVATVVLAMRRRSDNFYWNGRAWTAVVATLPAEIRGTNWLVRAPLPTLADRTTGVVELTVLATDRAKNRAAATARVLVDRVAPQVRITFPTAISAISSLSTVRGFALDTRDGSGLARVSFTLQRLSDRRFWNGDIWIATPTALATVLQTSGAWASSATLPATDDLTAGNYLISASAFDRGGLSATTTLTVRVVRSF